MAELELSAAEILHLQTLLRPLRIPHLGHLALAYQCTEHEGRYPAFHATVWELVARKTDCSAVLAFRVGAGGGRV